MHIHYARQDLNINFKTDNVLYQFLITGLKCLFSYSFYYAWKLTL
jgi:hypothetical protein